MDNRRRKKKTFDFVEGHKRETRKSYQSFIEETDKGKETDFPEWHHFAQVKMEESDECVRKSSRTPVPKKTFDLVDSFDEDKWRTKNSTNMKKTTQFDPSKLREMVEVKREPSDDTDSDTSAPRKSSRTPVPKKSFDLIDSGFQSFPNQNQNLLATEPIAEVPKQKKGKQLVQVEKSPAISSAKSSNKRKPSKDETPERKTEPKKQSSSNKDMSKLKVKVDFKSKKDRTNRKRKVEDEPGPASLPLACVEQDELSQKKRNFEENIDQSILMEALQALKQESYDYPAAKRAKPAQSEEASEVAKSSYASERKYVSRKKPQNLELDFDQGNVHAPIFDQMKPEGDLHPSNPNDEANIGKSAKDFSSSTTERPDGHIILKVGGLASPSKIKKHKKKHKHHHHDAEPVNDGIQSFPMEGTDALLNSQQYVNDVVIKTEPNEPDVFQIPNETLQECYSTDWQNDTIAEKKKKHRSHKKKKKGLSSVNDETKEVTVESKDDFIVKKRKIYKKKKGEKILVRIQTEFWDKNGALVKVEPSEIKEAGNLPQTKPKKNQKNDLTKANVITPKVKNKGLGHSEKVSQKPLAVHQDSVLKVVQDSGPLDVMSKKKKKPAKQKQTPRSDGKKKPKDGGGDAQNMASPVKKKKKERKTQTLTAYLLYCRKYRQKVVTENPEMGFSQISRKLAQMWNEAPEKEKDIYKKQLEEHRAKVNASIRKETLKKLKTTMQAGQSSPEKAPNSGSRMSSKEYQIAPQKYSVTNLEPVDMAAHLQLLGDSLMLVASALRRQVVNKTSDLKVYGSLSVLLDSCLCSMAPLLFLTSNVPELDVIPSDMKANILDNIAYILPGL